MDRSNNQWETPLIQVAPIFSGSLSAISSALIIYVILRSQTGLSSIYHRIMFGMSLADILSSTAVALSTLPMPSYMPQEEDFEYRWTGPRLGNTSTCNAQGFFQTFGILCMFTYNAMLCVYYACAIAFAMQETKIKQYVEPVLHVLPIIAGLVPAICFLVTDMYNPQMGNSLPQASWCTPSKYPLKCGEENAVECTRGFNASNSLLVAMGVMSSFEFLTIVISLSLVLHKVQRTERIFRGLFDDMAFAEELANTRIVLMQALFYVVAFLICVSPPFIHAITVEIRASQRTLERLLLVTLLLLPLQGSFNFFIFMIHKIYNYRRVNNAASIRDVIRLLFFSAAHEPCFISRISIIRNHEDSFDDESVDKRETIEIMMDDEGCNDETMRYRRQIMLRELKVSSHHSMDYGDEFSVSHDEKPLPVHHNMAGNNEHAVSISIGSSGLSFFVSDAEDEAFSYPSVSPFSVNGGMSMNSR